MSIAPVPFTAQITGLIPNAWRAWFTAVKTAIDTAALLVGSVALTLQGAAIATTAVPTPMLAAGLYRISYYTRITRAATTSSSLTVTLTWTDGTVTCTAVGAALTGNTTATTQSGAVLVRIDAATTLRYATAYASVGGTSMQHSLDITVQSVKA